MSNDNALSQILFIALISMIVILFILIIVYAILKIRAKVQEKNMQRAEEAIKKAILLAMEKINIKKQDKDKIITQKVLKKSLNNSTISLEVFFAIEEEIGYQETLDRDGEVS